MMRSTIPVSVFLSLALHAGAVLAIMAIALPHRSFSPRPDLSVVLTMLPTPQSAAESPGARAAPDEPAPSAAEPIVPEVRSDKAAEKAVPAEAPAEARVAEATPALPSQGPSVAPQSEVPPAAVAQDVPDARPASVPEAKTDITSAEAGKTVTVPSEQAANETVLPSAPILEPDGTKTEAVPSTVQADTPSVARATDGPPQSVAESAPPAAEARAGEVVPSTPSETASPAGPSVATTQPAESVLKADEPAMATTAGSPTVVASAAPESVAVSDALDDDAVLRRAGAFIEGYDGGPCVYVSAVRLAGGAADIDGLAASKPAFDAFHQGFSATMGFEPQVTGQLVWSQQCPAVDYLKRLHARRVAPPSITLDAVKVGSGAPLHGMIRDPAHRTLHLFLVSETGVVEDLTSTLTMGDGEASFTLTGRRNANGGPLPQLLVAVAGSIVVPKQPAGAVPANLFFDALGTGVNAPGAAAKLFLLGD